MRSSLALIVLLLSIFGYRSRYVLTNTILFKSNFPLGYYSEGEFDSNCQVVKADDQFQSCEDATFWELFTKTSKEPERRVIVSCDAGRHEWNTVMGPLRNPNPLGSLWIYKHGRKEVPQRLTLANYPSGHDFHPLGVDIYPSHAGNDSNMFVVNHARGRSYIEHFTLSPSSNIAQHIRTLSSPYFNAPNALALTSPNSFYLTNDHLFTRRIPYLGHVLPVVESVLGLPFSWVMHVTLDSNPKSGPAILSQEIVAPFIPFANGISMRHDGLEVAVSSSSLNMIHFYARNISNNNLVLQHKVPMPFNPDNIMYDASGSLIVGGHPNFPDLVKVAARKAPVSPSWIIQLTPASSTWTEGSLPTDFDTIAPVSASQKVPAVKSHEIKTLFQSNGTGFSSSTTGLHDLNTGTLYVPGLYSKGLLVCT
ncbi:hypothetical protein C8J56DRAFT_856582 [Mycena floridula]|nr:hypothetical protein C8J56DRAFT_856582 [Mycena floridula]